MKYVTTFITSLILFVSTSNNLSINEETNRKTIEHAVFDGNEGDLFFFTDENDKAVTIKDDDAILFKNFNHQANYYVGRKFNIIIKNNELINNVCESKSITQIELSKN